MDTKTSSFNEIKPNNLDQEDSPTFKIHQDSKHLIQKVMINITLLSLSMGYTMSYFNAINFDDLMVIFQLTMQKSFAQGLLTGCIPASACLGAFLSRTLLKNFSRKQCFDIMNIMCISSAILIQTKIIPFLFIGRLIQGSFIGAGTSIVPLYIKEFIPQMNGKYGIYHQIFFIGGVLSAFLLNMLFYLINMNAQSYWRWHFGFPIILSLYQAYMTHFHYNYETPRYLVSQNRDQEALDLLRKIYKEEFVQKQFHMLFQAVHFKKYTADYVEEFIQSPEKNYIDQRQGGTQLQDISPQKQNKHEISISSPLKSKINQSLLNPDRKTHNNPLAVFCALHLSIHQQMIGIGAVIVYSGDIIKQVFPSLFHYYAVIVHSFGLFCVILGLTLIQKYGRVFLMHVGSILIFIFLVVIGVNFLRGEDRNDWVIVVTVVLFRGVFASTLGPIVWLYIAEIVRPNIIPYGTMINWGGATLVMFLFPIMNRILGGPGWIFLFNAFLCALSIIINTFVLVESKDKNELTIRHDFDEKIEIFKKIRILRCFFND